MRGFNRQVYRETHESGSTARYTSAEFNDLLGSRDRLIVHYTAGRVSGTSPTLTIELEGSNNGQDWQSLVPLVSAEPLVAGNVNTGRGNSDKDLPAFVRLAITMGGTSPVAEVEIVACGRDSTS